jgi:hypothetical protein
MVLTLQSRRKVRKTLLLGNSQRKRKSKHCQQEAQTDFGSG